MTAICASCSNHFANGRDLAASTCEKHHKEAQIWEARKAFHQAREDAIELFPDSSPMNDPKTKRAWAKLKRLEKAA